MVSFTRIGTFTNNFLRTCTIKSATAWVNIFTKRSLLFHSIAVYQLLLTLTDSLISLSNTSHSLVIPICLHALLANFPVTPLQPRKPSVPLLLMITHQPTLILLSLPLFDNRVPVCFVIPQNINSSNVRLLMLFVNSHS
jgi:hypothetical protein